MSALLAAWEAAMAPANQDRVLAAVKKFDTGTQGAVQSAQLDATRDLVKPGPDIPVGRIQTEAWAQTEAIMLAQGLIRKPVNVVSRLRLADPIHRQ
jgi:NitT/TauT family transport system substrate-binding protein